MRNGRPSDLASPLYLRRLAAKHYEKATQVSNEIIDRFNSLAKRIEDLPESARLAIAVAIAQRLADEYLIQPEDQRSSFVAPWADMMPLLWTALTHPSVELKRILESKLSEYIGEFLDQSSLEYGQPKYDEDAGYACIAAIETYCGNSKAAAKVASFLLGDARRQAQRISTEMGESHMSANARARVLRLRHLELDRLDRAVTLLEDQGFSIGVLPQLNKLLTDERAPA
jgi:cell division septum initiation protein DivIVA